MAGKQQAAPPPPGTFSTSQGQAKTPSYACGCIHRQVSQGPRQQAHTVTCMYDNHVYLSAGNSHVRKSSWSAFPISSLSGEPDQGTSLFISDNNVLLTIKHRTLPK